jgi:phage tail sheath gpL-like
MPPLDASLEARQVGVEATYKDSRLGAVQFLPQRLYVVAQGETGVSYPTTKFTAQSANQVGQTLGYKSPAYLIARQLLPTNGDGVGTVPVTFAPLEDADGSSAATGVITPSGTATATGEYRANISEILGQVFAITADDNLTAKCVKLHDSINDTLGMPGTAKFTYGSATSDPGDDNTGNGVMGAITVDAAEQPRPGVYSLVCTAEASGAGTFSVTDPDGTALPNLTVAAAYDSGTGLTFTLADGAEDFDIGDTFEITVPATTVSFTSGWAGQSANALKLRVDGPTDLGVSWAYTQPTGGAVNPTVDAALAQVGNVWESMVLNALNISDSTALNAYQTWGEGRWGATVKKPAVVFTGADVTTVASAIAIPDARKTDRVNVQLPAPYSRHLPFVIAARQVARIVRMANNNPAHDYCLQKADGLVPGADGDQWDLLGRDQAVKGGSSTIEVIDGVVNISNVVTFYHPTGEVPPAYRYVCDIVKLQNVIYNADLIFSQPEWAGAPLVPDNQLVTNPTAKKPKMAKAALGAMFQNLGLAAILSDPTTAAKNVTAVIDSQNPKRLNIIGPIQIAGNTNIIDVGINWSFFFGTAAAA